MTALMAHSHVPDAAGGLADALRMVRYRTGCDVLLDSGDGELVDHAVACAAPAVVVRAVLSKDLSSMVAASAAPRTMCVVSGGPVIRWRIGPDLEAAVVPVRGGVPARLWLLGGDVRIGRALAQEVSDLVAPMLDNARPDPDLQAVIAGSSPLPAGWQGQPLTVAVVRTRRAHVTLSALRAAAGTRNLPALAGIAQDAVLALVAGPHLEWACVVDRELRLHDNAARGAYAAGDPDGAALPRLLAVAQAAAAVSDVPLQDARMLTSRVAVQRAGSALLSAPVDEEVLFALLRHDRDRGTDLARTLLAWLDLHGDVTAAAQRLNVHVNTLRYRVRRAAELLAGDIGDPDVRLDVHLRLRHAALTGSATTCV